MLPNVQPIAIFLPISPFHDVRQIKSDKVVIIQYSAEFWKKKKNNVSTRNLIKLFFCFFVFSFFVVVVENRGCCCSRKKTIYTLTCLLLQIWYNQTLSAGKPLGVTLNTKRLHWEANLADIPTTTKERRTCLQLTKLNNLSLTTHSNHKPKPPIYLVDKTRYKKTEKLQWNSAITIT